MKRLAGVLLAVSAVVVLFGPPLYAAWAAVVAFVAAWILDPPAVRAGLRAGAVLAIVFAASITAAVVTWAEGPERGIELGGMVLLRLLVLAVAAAVLVRSVNAETLLRMTRRLGFERLGLVLGLALNSLPRLAEAASEVWTASRVRSDGAVARLRRLPGVGEVLLAHTARIAEEAAAAASLRGHAALTRQGDGLTTPVRVVVVTGPSDGGKTETVRAAAERLRSSGVSIAGFVQPGEFAEGRKVGFRLRDAATGEEAPLATLLGERSEGEFGTRFQFSDEGFRLGREALARSASESVVIIDELGPVELRGQGHMPAVRTALAVPGLLGAVIVVRRTLVPSLLAELDASDAVVIDVESVGDRCVESILTALAIER
jgi:nucleoside-triphosphatase THEP1/energy-coupling factor transporter transmembrane protein EcfT